MDWIGTEAARKDDGKEGIDESVKGNQVHSLGNLHVEFPEMEICELDSFSQCSSQREFCFPPATSTLSNISTRGLASHVPGRQPKPTSPNLSSRMLVLGSLCFRLASGNHKIRYDNVVVVDTILISP